MTWIMWRSFLPGGKSWIELNKLIHDARMVYMKLEVNELIILLYFGGFSALKKTVIGLHSPFQYSHARLSLIERLHNVVYSSSIIGAMLRRAKKVHILSFEQEKNVRMNHDLKNLVVIPNFVNESPAFHAATADNRLHIAFVGELTPRKGADVLLKVIDQAPRTNLFDIIGDGPLKGAFLEKKRENMTYHGYLPQKKIAEILSRSDALLMPSQAESFSLVSLEALSHGLSVICSPNISPSILDPYLEMNRTGTVDDYLTNVDRLGQEKLSGELARKRKQIWKEISERFSKTSIMKRLKKEVFESSS